LSTRERLLDAAREVCRVDGIERLTMRRIAGRARVTAPAIYRHFAGKEDVLQALVDDANAKLAVHLDRAGPGDGPGAHLAATAEAILDFALSDPAAYDALFFSRGRNDADLRPHRRRSPNFRKLLERVEACRDGGVLTRGFDAMQIALALWSMMHGVLALHVQGRFGGDEKLLRRVFRDNLEQLLVGIRERGTGR
jgi:AcrR family transcriptional regulator